jgi:hypothetical protein
MTAADRSIFVIGSPRSGTTLMRAILDSHPNIFCPIWETGLFVHLGALMNGDLQKILKTEGDTFPLGHAELIAWVRRLAVDLFDQFGKKAAKPRWAEKTPGHVHHVNLIHEVFPHAQFIHMIRSGYDVVKSLQNMPWAPRRIGWSTQTWVSSVQAGRAAGAKLPPGHYLEVRYEKLIEQPQAVLEEMCKFLGEPFAPQMLEFHDPDKNTWKAQHKPLQNKPVNSYRNLSLWQRLAFSWSAGWLMRDLGYQ